MYHEYPYTTYYNDIDRLCKCCKALQIHLDTHGDYLRLINDKDGSVISAVKVSYADTALTDVDGNPIKTYLISAGTNGTHLVFTKGNNEVISFEVPFAQTAAKDVQDKDILDYVYGVSISGNKVRITNGDGTVYELTVPFATAAAETVDGYDLTMLACALVTDGNELVLKDTKGNELSRITPNFAVKAQKDVDGDDIKSTYANSMTQTATTLKLLAKDGTVLDEETINYATTSLKDTDGNLFLSDYVEKIVVDGDDKRIGVEAHDGTRLATITVPFATLATDATNAVENVQVIGDQIVLTTYGGQTFAITAPYAIKAQKDDLNNTIKNTYFAGVDNDTDAGTISFYDATGTLLATISNGVITHAIYDNYDNPLAGYIKTLAATAGSDYLTATHGDGTVDSITVDYANRAWKDTNGNVIKNTYVKRLAIAQDPDDGQWKLFAFNGDNPEALLFALVIVAEQAYKDVNGKLLTSYLAHVDIDNGDLVSTDGEDNEVDRVTLPKGAEKLTLEGNIDIGGRSKYCYCLKDGQNNILDSAKIFDFNTYGLSLRQVLDMDNYAAVVWTAGDGNVTLNANTNYMFVFGKKRTAASDTGLKYANILLVESGGHIYAENTMMAESGYGTVLYGYGLPSAFDNISVYDRALVGKDRVTVDRNSVNSSYGDNLTLLEALATQFAKNFYAVNAFKQSGDYVFSVNVTTKLDTAITPTLDTVGLFDVYADFTNSDMEGGPIPTI